MVFFIDNETAEKLVDIDSMLQDIERGYRDLSNGDTSYRPRIDFYVPSETQNQFYRWGSVEGVDPKKNIFAVRMKSDVIYWTQNGREEKYCGKSGQYCGFVFLFDSNNGMPLAIINDGYIQHMRVGASAGIGAKYLSRKDSEIVGVIGSGGMARSHVLAVSRVRDISKIRVYSPSPEHRKLFAKDMRKQLNIEVEECMRPEMAFKNSDIVMSCTSSNVSTMKSEWLEEGMHLSVVRAVESDENVLKRADLKVTLIGSTFKSIYPEGRIEGMGLSLGAIGGASAAFAVGKEERYAKIMKRDRRNKELFKGAPTLMDIVSEKKRGRTSDSQITYFDNIEGAQGVQFAYICSTLYERAEKGSTSKVAPTEWFLENIKN